MFVLIGVALLIESCSLQLVYVKWPSLFSIWSVFCWFGGLWSRFLSLPSANLRLFRHCIELESNLAHSGINDGLVNARKLYESALDLYKDDVSLWREYYFFELKVRNFMDNLSSLTYICTTLKLCSKTFNNPQAGSPEAANAVNWRARKILKDRASILGPEKFWCSVVYFIWLHLKQCKFILFTSIFPINSGKKWVLSERV